MTEGLNEWNSKELEKELKRRKGIDERCHFMRVRAEKSWLLAWHKSCLGDRLDKPM